MKGLSRLLCSSVLKTLVVSSLTLGFIVDRPNNSCRPTVSLSATDDSEPSSRRQLLQKAGLVLGNLAVLPSTALAGIDVSGLQQQPASNNVIRDQLKGYDGSANTRVQQIKEISSSSSGSFEKASTALPKSDVPETAATAAYRYTLGGARTKGEGLLFTRYQDSIQGRDSNEAIPIEFIYPTDWLQLGKALGTLQFVDQRNGDKLYVLRVRLPEGQTLETVNKSFLGNAIFDPKGSFVTTGNDVSEYKVSSSKMLVSSAESLGATPRRRLKVKYTTITGNNYSIERRGLVDCYEIGGNVYMLMTSSNAVKFEAGGRERDTVESMVDSFRVGM